MSFIAIMDWDGSDHPVKHRSFATQVEADQFVLDNAGIAPGTRADAFVVVDPEIQNQYITADPVLKTITIDTIQRDADVLSVAVNSFIKNVDALREVKIALPILSEGFQISGGTFVSGSMANSIFAFNGESISITSITRSGSTATVVTAENHHLDSGQSVTVSGADQADYNIQPVVTVIDKTTFTYTVAGTPTSPATGTIVAVIATFPWIDFLNNIVFWSNDTFNSIHKDATKYDQDCWMRGRVIKNLGLVAVSVGEIQAIDIAAGWPDTGL